MEWCYSMLTNTTHVASRASIADGIQPAHTAENFTRSMAYGSAAAIASHNILTTFDCLGCESAQLLATLNTK
jgi:hypothetical protein